MYTPTTGYFEINYLFIKYHYGYRKGHCIIHATLKLLDRINAMLVLKKLPPAFLFFVKIIRQQKHINKKKVCDKTFHMIENYVGSRMTKYISTQLFVRSTCFRIYIILVIFIICR